MFANPVSEEGLLSQVWKELVRLTSQRHMTRFENGPRTFIDRFPKSVYTRPTGPGKVSQALTVRECKQNHHERPLSPGSTSVIKKTRAP